MSKQKKDIDHEAVDPDEDPVVLTTEEMYSFEQKDDQFKDGEFCDG